MGYEFGARLDSTRTKVPVTAKGYVKPDLSIQTVTGGRPGVNPGGVVEPPPTGPTPFYLKPFTSDSYWNTTIRDGSTYYTSTDPATVSFRSVGGNMNYDANWCLAIWYTKESDPTTTFRNQAGTTTYYTGYYPANWHIPGPAYPTERDSWVAIIQPDGKSSIETYKTWYSGTTSSVTYFWSSIPPKRMYLDSVGHALNTDGINTALSTQGARASKWSYMGGAVRKWEVLAKTIDHALEVAIPDSALKVGYIYPARGEDANAATNYAGNCPMGTRFALPPTVDITTLGLSAEGVALARACQRHGVFVGDRSGACSLTAERANPTDPDVATYRAACARMSTDWNTIQNYMVRVSGTTSTLPGGPGNIQWPDPPEGSLSAVP